jgi:aminoglycoside phosphotransferase (APT) family kinase protein
MAEVYAYDEGRVVKLDRPEWSGVAAFESDVITRVAQAGIPVARSHGVVTIDDRCGVILDRVDGRELLWDLIDIDEQSLDAMADRFARLQMSINSTVIDGLPDLVSRLGTELERGVLPADLTAELIQLLEDLDDGHRGVCHFDFHPLNVLVRGSEWVVIDWLTVATGPSVADLARTMVLAGQSEDPPIPQFMRAVRRYGLASRETDEDTCAAWVRVVAGARLAEGLDDASSTWLRRVAEGNVALFA